MILSEIYKVKAGIEEIQKEKLPAIVAFKLQNFYSRILEPAKNAVEIKDRLIIEKYGEKCDDGSYRVTKDNEEKFNEEYGKLLDEDIDVGDVPEIPVSQLGDVNLSIKTCLLLDGILKDG